jgi:hypothetical protein
MTIDKVSEIDYFADKIADKLWNVDIPSSSTWPPTYTLYNKIPHRLETFEEYKQRKENEHT